MARSTLLALPLVLLVAFATATAQVADPGKPPVAPKADYALTNVRIVTAPGKVIERGTVVIRDGRIAAVGAQAQVPAGVVRMDLAGHSVYPGMIDAATSVGLPSPTRAVATPAADTGGGGRGRGGGRGQAAPAQGRGGAGRGATTPPPPVVLPEIDPDAEAADQFAPTEDQLKAFRAGGVTTVGLVFNGGIFPGRVGAASTGVQDESRLAIRAGAAQEVSFGTKRGGYPSVGIGSVAFIRQAFLDAQYELRLEKAMKAGTPGARPSNDPFRRALMPAAANDMPTWWVASKERDMTRVAAIVKEMGLKNPVIVGAQEGWHVIPTLKQSGASAVVSLNWPAPDSVTGYWFSQLGPTVGTVKAPTQSDIRGNAASLAKAGITVALASFGGESGATFRDRVRSTIEAGMTPDDALRAVTVAPATLLGISSAVGTIEAGKLANLVVVTGNDLFASGNPIKHVFVEGRLY
jgi:imidazolonepropionase-like amidohydrolase